MKPLLSPDCRDNNHSKCDGVAWDLEIDMASACECDCQCNGKAAFTIYPHSMEGQLEVIIDGEGTIRGTLGEADRLAWDKALTRPELAAEYYRATGGMDEVNYDRMGRNDVEPIPTILRRFATSHHYDHTP
ncbi:hypothetical protein HOU96_gp46 [Arthrobacter phage Maja]|uniref:Uncharacterized protein n=1 Tax=Arthrobacter phage Maja TaxID=2499009 RepID=A0A3S9UN29_9CAUD|nr:hypothetical protein HOU96_gp46 [Arthrobacter phage Maja]AZS11744.1 hypothetical protein PBI_MAJA_46 [Arthrobacter phage Maja]